MHTTHNAQLGDFEQEPNPIQRDCENDAKI